MNVSNLKFSVIVSAYNVQDFIEKAMKSLLQQNYDNFEIIVVNDGSSDNTELILESFQTNEKVRVIKKKNGGLSSTRNRGVEAATGDVIVFVDGDDYVEPNLLHKCANAFQSTNSEMVFFGYNSVNEKNKVIKKGIHKQYEYSIRDSRSILSDLCSNKLNNYSWSFATLRNVFDRINKPIFPENVFFEDVGSTYKIIASVNKAVFIPDVLYHYVQRRGSITKTPGMKQFTDLSSIELKINEELESIVDPEFLKLWKFFLDVTKFQIISYKPVKNKDLIRQQRKTILSESPRNLDSIVAKVKLVFIWINLYQWLYPLAARLRWL